MWISEVCDDMRFDIIEKIKSPADIKAMSLEELQQAASQMRDAVLFRTSQFSGHVGPNLGDIEAVIAMHYVFDAPEDKLVLDVSHQDFPHKMITGRVNGFINPDDFAKVGEYTDPTESPEYDIFYGALSCAKRRSTSLSEMKPTTWRSSSTIGMPLMFFSNIMRTASRTVASEATV